MEMQQIGSLCDAQMGHVLGNKRGRVCGGLSASHSREEGSDTGSCLIPDLHTVRGGDQTRYDGMGSAT